MNIFWFRRDLRTYDNTGLFHALENCNEVQPIFIFDKNIIDELEDDDPRVNFIYFQLEKIYNEFKKFGCSLRVYYGDPLEIFKEIISKVNLKNVYTNRDYEPYGIDRDKSIEKFLKYHNINFKSFKDQVIFEKDEVVKNDGLPYTVFTPYKNKWLANFKENKPVINHNLKTENLKESNHDFPNLEDFSFRLSKIKVPEFDLKKVPDYDATRNYPFIDGTSRIGPHLRFGTVSVREIVEKVKAVNETYLSELIWREFFMQILFHFPHTAKKSFKSKYDKIIWLNDPKSFEAWKNGETGFPLVDAGMKELNNRELISCLKNLSNGGKLIIGI